MGLGVHKVERFVPVEYLPPTHYQACCRRRLGMYNLKSCLVPAHQTRLNITLLLETSARAWLRSPLACTHGLSPQANARRSSVIRAASRDAGRHARQWPSFPVSRMEAKPIKMRSGTSPYQATSLVARSRTAIDSDRPVHWALVLEVHHVDPVPEHDHLQPFFAAQRSAFADKGLRTVFWTSSLARRENQVAGWY